MFGGLPSDDGCEHVLAEATEAYRAALGERLLAATLSGASRTAGSASW
jgi:hypothetical protein